MANRFDIIAGGIVGFGSLVIGLVVALIVWGTSMESLIYGMTITCLLAVIFMPLYFAFYRKKYAKQSDSGDVVAFGYAMSTGLIIPLIIIFFVFHSYKR